jgi:hypothetical protein
MGYLSTLTSATPAPRSPEHQAPHEHRQAVPPRQPPSVVRRTSSLWEAYRDSGDPALRDQLVFFLTQLVRHLPTRKARQLPTFCELPYRADVV